MTISSRFTKAARICSGPNASGRSWAWMICGSNSAYGLEDLGNYYLDYARLMAHWDEVFPSEIMTVQYEDLVLDLETISRRLIDHLGLEWDERCLDFHNNRRPVRTASNAQVRRPIYKHSVNRWKHYEKHLGPLLSLLHQG